MKLKRTAFAWTVAGAAVLSALAIALSNLYCASTGADDMSPASTIGKPSPSGRTEKAYFAAGCFWGIEAAFRRVEGVTDTAVGYCGGTTPNPTYKQVCTDKTGHAETVQVTYDPEKVSYKQLLDVFWSCHNPTQLNSQGPDVGTQYRSAIFYTTPQQEAAAKASRDKLQQSGKSSGESPGKQSKIVTRIVPASTFYRAEEYHQQYLAKRGQASCRQP